MECPNCKSNTRSRGMENGDEKPCSHCGVLLMVVDRPYNTPTGGRWEIVPQETT